MVVFVNREISKKLIPPCVIGTWGYGSGYNGAKMVFGKSYSEEQLWDTFETAYELGFTMWDTAEVYGMGNDIVLEHDGVLNPIEIK